MILIFLLYFQEDCRKIICPNGAINTPDGCKLFAKTWYVTGYEIHVIMTPTSERRIPLPEFNGHAKNVTDINEWLDTKGLDINHLMMYAEEREENNITYLGVLNMKLGSNRYPLKAPKLLKAIDKSLSRQWVITVNKIVYTYDIQFDKYENFVQTGEFYRTRWIGTDKGLSSAASNEPFKLPKVYTPVLFRAKMVGLQMNKMYFCERIELIKKEWSGAYSGIWLNVTGSGNDTFLGDGEYSYEQDSFGTNDVIVQICVDDFLSQFVSTENTAHSFGYTIPLISISVLIQF